MSRPHVRAFVTFMLLGAGIDEFFAHHVLLPVLLRIGTVWIGMYRNEPAREHYRHEHPGITIADAAKTLGRQG